MSKKGFTLIELLVVISIIALLSSIVLAAINDARTKADITATQQSFTSLRNALELYQQDNGSYPPNSSFADLMISLSPYIKTTPILPTSLNGGNVNYINNPKIMGGSPWYYTCGSPTNGSSPPYVVNFTAGSALLNKISWPNMYYSVSDPNNYNISASYRCIFMPPQ